MLHEGTGRWHVSPCRVRLGTLDGGRRDGLPVPKRSTDMNTHARPRNPVRRTATSSGSDGGSRVDHARNAGGDLGILLPSYRHSS